MQNAQFLFELWSQKIPSNYPRAEPQRRCYEWKFLSTNEMLAFQQEQRCGYEPELSITSITIDSNICTMPADVDSAAGWYARVNRSTIALVISRMNVGRTTWKAASYVSASISTPIICARSCWSVLAHCSRVDNTSSSCVVRPTSWPFSVAWYLRKGVSRLSLSVWERTGAGVGLKRISSGASKNLVSMICKAYLWVWSYLIVSPVLAEISRRGWVPIGF